MRQMRGQSMCASEQFHHGLAPILSHQCRWPARENVVALTMGMDGVIMAFGDTIEHVVASHAEVVDPTGAGDAFAAGFLAEWVRTNDPIAAALCGVLVGARAVETIGGRPPRL